MHHVALDTPVHLHPHAPARASSGQLSQPLSHVREGQGGGGVDGAAALGAARLGILPAAVGHNDSSCSSQRFVRLAHLQEQAWEGSGESKGERVLVQGRGGLTCNWPSICKAV